MRHNNTTTIPTSNDSTLIGNLLDWAQRNHQLPEMVEALYGPALVAEVGHGALGRKTTAADWAPGGALAWLASDPEPITPALHREPAAANRCPYSASGYGDRFPDPRCFGESGHTGSHYAAHRDGTHSGFATARIIPTEYLRPMPNTYTIVEGADECMCGGDGCDGHDSEALPGSVLAQCIACGDWEDCRPDLAGEPVCEDCRPVWLAAEPEVCPMCYNPGGAYEDPATGRRWHPDHHPANSPVCEWFLMCDRTATHRSFHRAMGRWVLICERCALVTGLSDQHGGVVPLVTYHLVPCCVCGTGITSEEPAEPGVLQTCLGCMEDYAAGVGPGHEPEPEPEPAPLRRVLSATITRDHLFDEDESLAYSAIGDTYALGVTTLPVETVEMVAKDAETGALAYDIEVTLPVVREGDISATLVADAIAQLAAILAPEGVEVMSR